MVFMGGCESGPDSEEAEPVTAIAGYELAPMDLSRVVQASATVEAENVVTIASRMDGLITLLNAREGDSIEAGQKLLEFDIEQQQAELERAQAEMELAEAVFERTEQLYEREAISAAEYEEARANLKVAESEVKLLDTQVQFGTVRAQNELRVLDRYVEQGDAVSAADPLFHVADLNRLVVRVGIPERDVVHLETGQSAEVRIDAFPGEHFPGVIQRIYPAANEESRLFTVEISLRTEQKDLQIRPGYLARVAMDADQRKDVLAVPSESLLGSGDEEQTVYVISQNDRLEERHVETGIERRNWTQILEGLQSGEVVVGANPSNLREDIQVQVTRWVENDSPEVAESR